MVDLVPELLETTVEHLGEYGFDATGDPETAPGGATHYRVLHEATGQTFRVVVTSTSLVPGDLDERGSTILAMPYISPAEVGRLRAAGVAGYVDASGNALIAAPGLYVDVRGRPRARLAREARLQENAGWERRPTGLQVMFTLLTQPGSLGLTLAEIADRSGVSVATAHRVLSDLTHQHLIDGSGRDRFWVEPRTVVAAWLGGYQGILGRKVPEARYVCDVSPDEWPGLLQAEGGAALLTADAALVRMGAPLRAVTTTMYAADVTHRTTARVRRPRSGEPTNLVVRTPWWPSGVYEGVVVPPLLVYADAIRGGDPRVITVADEIIGGVDALAAAVA